MRWLFVGILILNVGFLGWHLLAPVSGSVPQAAIASEFPARVLLLDERSASPQPPGEPVSPAPVPSAVPAVPPLAGCPAFGPLSPADAAAQVATLAAAGYPAQVISPAAAQASVFWVHIPPAVGREAALRTLRELHARGVESFVVAEGADANAISLGSFQNRDSALGVQARLASTGYQVKIREQARGGGQVWVVLADPAAQGFSERLRLPHGAAIKRMPCATGR